MQLPPPVTTIFNFIFQMGLPQNKTKNTAALPPKDIIELETFSHLWMVTDNFLKSSEPVV